MNKSKKRRVGRIILIVSILLIIVIPYTRQLIKEVFLIFAKMDVNEIIELLRSFGPWAIVISFFLMVFQSIAAPLPAFLLTFANAALWGWWKGAIISWSSAMVGALLCYHIARVAGRDAVERLTSKFAMDSVDIYFEKYGKNTILICRLLPFVSFDFISYAAGLTSMSTGSFLLATGIGQLPATIVYSYVGGMLTGSTKMIAMALFITFALFALVALAKKMYNDKVASKKTGEKNE